MSGTVIYFDALKELALKHILSKYATTELDVTIRGKWSPITDQEYRNLSAVVDEEVQTHVAWMVTCQEHVLKTPTFFLSTYFNEDSGVVRNPATDNARAHFAFMSGLDDKVTLLPGGSFPKQDWLNSSSKPLELEAMIPLETARLFGVDVGDRLVLVPPWEDTVSYMTVVVSGVFYSCLLYTSPSPRDRG